MDEWTQQANVPVNCANAGIGSVGYSNGIWKLIVASGTQYPDSPWVINNTQIFTDTLCPDPNGITGNKNRIPEKFSLGQNYPNPFNPATKISFSLSKPGEVKLVVFDVLGRKIEVLVDEYKKEGTYSVEFNALHLTTGIYIYRIESSDFTDTKKMLLIK